MKTGGQKLKNKQTKKQETGVSNFPSCKTKTESMQTCTVSDLQTHTNTHCANYLIFTLPFPPPPFAFLSLLTENNQSRSFPMQSGLPVAQDVH